VLATADEHGWLEPLTSKSGGTYQGGVAYLMGQLVSKEAYRASTTVLLSAGDMWTGPYESTVLKGRPMVQAMNAMGYDAAAVGNHDLDFGEEVLLKRAGEAAFPFLSANLRTRTTRATPGYARPFTVTEAAGVRVGVVGLTTLETPYTTDRRFLAGLELEPYVPALARAVPAAREAGAELVVVLAHAELSDMRQHAASLRALGINLVLCGHRHAPGLEVDAGDPATPADDVVFCSPGPYARSYCRVELSLDGKTRAFLGHTSSIETVAGQLARPTFAPHDGLMGLVAEARSQAEVQGNEVLAEVPAGLARQLPAHTMGHLVVDTWLQAVPAAEFALTNAGGFRQDVAPGPVRMRDLIGAMPFDNYLVVVKLRPDQVAEALENPQTIPGGLSFEYRQDPMGKRTVTRVLDRQGIPLDRTRTYAVVVNDFMYRGGDRYRFKEQDPAPRETGLHWREPVARYMRAMTAARAPVVAPAGARMRVVP
jgi:2',3'-cyclic-nucleotide 2'-phosphodiesterase (5'-nucleotidase family)